MKPLFRIPLSLALLAAAPFVTTAAGVVFEVETTDHKVSPPAKQVITISAEGEDLAADFVAGKDGSGRVIFKSADGKMIVVDDADKSYFALDRQKVQGAATQMQGMMAEALKNVPADRRAEMEKMLKQRMPQPEPKSDTELKRSGKTVEKNGYECEMVDVWKAGRRINEMCVTAWNNIEGAEQVAAAFSAMGDFVRDLTDTFSQAMGGGGGGGSIGPQFGQDVFSQLSKLGGFPVYAREYDEAGTLIGESNLRSATQKAIGPAAFNPPAGYKANSMFGMEGG